MTSIAVVIVTYNSADYIDQLLDSLPLATEGFTYSTVVVDNGSQDDTVVRVTRRSDCQLIESVNDGFAAGVNRAVRASEPADAILIVNPDATLDAGSVVAMYSIFEKRSRVGIVVPRLREPNGELFPSLRRTPTLLRGIGLSFLGRPAFVEKIETTAYYDREQVVDWATGAVMLVNPSCYEELRGLDESYFLYSEETDFCLRAKDAGWNTIYTPQAGATHVGGGSGRSARTRTMQIVNRVRLYRRRSGPIRSVLYFTGALGGELRRAAFGSRVSLATAGALVMPARRPVELLASDSLVPR